MLLKLLPLLIFATAILYSVAGQAGASGYLAAMALCGVAPDIIKPAALILNTLVAIVGTARYYQAGQFSWQMFAPFAIASIPLAVVGGAIDLPSTIYKRLLGVAMLIAAVQLLLPPSKVASETKALSLPIALLCGGAIGLLSGLTGMGGGVLLTPLILFMDWGEPKQAAGVSMAFNLINSLAALAGHFALVHSLPREITYWALAAVIGGLIGSGLGSRRLNATAVRRVLGVVLAIAAAKLMLA